MAILCVPTLTKLDLPGLFPTFTTKLYGYFCLGQSSISYPLQFRSQWELFGFRRAKNNVDQLFTMKI